MPADTAPPWDRVTAAFGGELDAWEAYAAEIRLWTEAMRIRFETGHAPSEEHVRVIGDLAPEVMLEQADWVASSAERTAERLRECLAAGEIRHALLTALSPGPGARGFDHRAPGFWRGPLEPGDLRPVWEVSDRQRSAVLSEALFPDAAPRWFLRTLQPWARPIARALWTDTYGLREIASRYASHLAETGNPWASGETGVEPAA